MAKRGAESVQEIGFALLLHAVCTGSGGRPLQLKVTAPLNFSPRNLF